MPGPAAVYVPSRGGSVSGLSDVPGLVDALEDKVDSPLSAADIPAGIGADKIGDGSVSTAEYQRINSLTSNAQDQLNALVAADAALAAADALRDQYSGTTGGSANAYTATPTVALTNTDGVEISCKIHAANTGASTLAVSGQTAKPIYKRSAATGGATALVGAELSTNSIHKFVYSTSVNSGAGGWILTTPWPLLYGDIPALADVQGALAATTTASASYTTLKYTTSSLNGWTYNSSTGQWTNVLGGWWEIGAIYLVNNAASASLNYTKNGTVVRRTPGMVAQNGVGLVASAKFAPGDTLDIQAFTGTGGAVDTATASLAWMYMLWRGN